MIESQPEERDEIVEERRFDPADHCGKIVLASPIIMALVSHAMIDVFDVPNPASPLRSVGLTLLIVNAILASIGSAVGGSLIRGSISHRVMVGILCGGFGLFTFSLTFCFGPPTH